MEQNFQTSFIPKKPIMEERVTRSRSMSFLTMISALVLFTSVIAVGGLYLYNNILSKNIEEMKNDLERAKARFEPERIIELKDLDRRLIASSEILSKHVAISPIFKALEDITMKTVSYTKFSYNADGLNSLGSGNISITLGGIAVGYKSIALQSDLFAKNKIFIDPVFSNLSLDDRGNVLFDLKFSVDANFMNYQKNIEEKDVTFKESSVTPLSSSEDNTLN